MPPSSEGDELCHLRWASWQLEIIKFNEKMCEANKYEDEKEEQLFGLDIEEEATLTINEINIKDMKYNIKDLQMRFKESVSQRSILESIISERLESEKNAISKSESLQKSLLELNIQYNDLIKENSNKNIEYENQNNENKSKDLKLKVLEEKLLEVETFLTSNQGFHVMNLESELAKSKLLIAELESEKDELEQQLNDYLMNEEEEGEEGGEDIQHAHSIISYKNELVDNENVIKTSVARMTIAKSTKNDDHNRKPLSQWNGQTSSLTLVSGN